MRLLRHPATYLGLAWILFLASLAYVAARLPERVASRFDFSGQANSWMSRPAYLSFTLAVGLGLPLFLAGLCWATQFLPPSMVNLPHKEYWLAPERRAATARWLSRYALWLSAMMALFVTGMNLLTLAANHPPSPHLSNSLVYALAGLLLAGTAAWCVGLYRHFRLPDQPAL